MSNLYECLMLFVCSQTEYEGQIKTLTQYIDPTTDGIVVAGGDGTLLEVSKCKKQYQITNCYWAPLALGLE